MINFIGKMEPILPYKIFFIGDSAATIDFGNLIDEEINKKVISLFDHLSRHPVEGIIEAIPAYSSLTIYYDTLLLRKNISPQKKVFESIRNELHKLMRSQYADDYTKGSFFRIPVCYENEFGIDLKFIADQKNISQEQIIQMHVSRSYRVYMLGFLPGFAYMGQVDEQIAIPRKPQPRPILAGSVGIAGTQTGIYPLNSPGGWQIIGRTPLKMFDKAKEEPCLVKAGDQVQFYSITRDEFKDYQSGSI
jgi:inhibitor of KinA